MIKMTYCGKPYNFPTHPGEVADICGDVGVACPNCLRSHITRLEAALAYKQTMLDGCESEIRHREEIDKVQRTRITILENQIIEGKAVLQEAEGVRVVPGPTANANHPVCRCCGGAAYELPSGVYLRRVNDFGVPGIWQCSESCQPLHASRVLKDGEERIGANTCIGCQAWTVCPNLAARNSRKGCSEYTAALRAQPTEGGA